MEHIVHAFHGIFERALVPYIADVKLDFVRHIRHPGLEIVPHVVLLLLIAGENPYFPDVSPKKTVQHGVAKAARTSGDEQRFSFKNTHSYVLLKNYLSVDIVKVCRSRGSSVNTPCSTSI